MLKMKAHEDKALTATPQTSAYLNISPLSLIPTFTFPGRMSVRYHPVT